MKKITFLLIALILTSTSYAAQQTNQPASQPSPNQNHSFYQSVKNGWNSFLDVLAGKGSRYAQNDRQTMVQDKNAEVKPSSASAQNKTKQNSQSDSSNSFYDSVSSGWNSFIDVLSGPKK